MLNVFKEYKCEIHGYGWIPDDDSVSKIINPSDYVIRCSICSATVKQFHRDYPQHKHKIKINILSDSEKQHAKCGRYAQEEWEKTLSHWKKLRLKPTPQISP